MRELLVSDILLKFFPKRHRQCHDRQVGFYFAGGCEDQTTVLRLLMEYRSVYQRRAVTIGLDIETPSDFVDRYVVRT